ncbi:TIM barrel protein [Inquilinus sp. OTU3971]|uniref:TIM barrel protein n=1 Tax=Inquilinus sp. OTU3971 TaxID=3043855 RepID=UPI00313C2DC0
METDVVVALNHMVVPALDVPRFFDLAAGLGCRGVEIRNDLGDDAVAGGLAAEAVARLAAQWDVTILSINALQRFNDWTEARAEEARALADYAGRCGAGALVLVPVNDSGWQLPPEERRAGLRRALSGLAPILADSGILGLVEPLGFEICSLRSKREAVAVIDELGLGDRFRLVHDTFHHHLAGEPDLFPDRTGLVHMSGVEDRTVPLAELRDAHRVLVGPADMIGNALQIRALHAGGYRGPVSFEPFAASVHADPDIAGALRGSIDHLGAALVRMAAE